MTPKPFFVPTTNVKNPIKIVETFGQSLTEVHALVHTPGEIGRGDLAVVLRLEGHAVATKLTTQIIMVGKRAIVHEALVKTR